MANFQPIMMWVLRQEDSTLSGKVVNLMDGQGLTRFGIGQTSHPNLPADFYTNPAALALLDAEQVYKGQYWDRFLGDSITDDGVASCLLSFAINDGEAREVQMLQQCLSVPVDSVMGPVTLAHTNAYNPTLLAAALRAAQADFYRACVAKQPTDARFLTGWLARAARIYPSLA
jgi:lysozyme family protein